jgi:hypothetical protein
LNVEKLVGGKDRYETRAIFRFLSRNEQMGSYKATEEEKLVEVINELTDHLEEDLVRDVDAEQDELEVVYPKFFKAVKAKAEAFKEDRVHGYRQLCCVPSFVLGLAMVGRVGRHYKHCSWFVISQLGKMLGVYGGVRIVK